MAKKKRLEKPRRELTKRQLSRWQQQQKRQRIILGAGIFIITTVIVILVVGWYVSQYRPLHQTIIRVNDTEFDMEYYVDMLKLSGSDQPAEYMQYIANSIVKDIEQNELIKQGALKLGISVSDDEVKEKLKSLDLPVNDVNSDLVRNQTLIEKLGDEYFGLQVPASAEQRHIMAMLLESNAQATEVRDRLENSGNFTELAGELSLDYFSMTNKGDFGWHPKSILSELLVTSTPLEYAFDLAQTDIRREFVFRHHVEELDLPARKVTREEAAAARQAESDLLKQGPIDVNSNPGMRLRRHRQLLERYEKQGDDPRYSMDLHVLRLGDVAIATNPFELYLDYGLRMKAQSVADQTLVVQLTCDRGIYLPTAKAIAGGHYGAMVSDNIVGPEGGEVLVERTVELINGMWDEKGE